MPQHIQPGARVSNERQSDHQPLPKPLRADEEGSACEEHQAL